MELGKCWLHGSLDDFFPCFCNLIKKGWVKINRWWKIRTRGSGGRQENRGRGFRKQVCFERSPFILNSFILHLDCSFSSLLSFLSLTHSNHLPLQSTLPPFLFRKEQAFHGLQQNTADQFAERQSTSPVLRPGKAIRYETYGLKRQLKS